MKSLQLYHRFIIEGKFVLHNFRQILVAFKHPTLQRMLRSLEIERSSMMIVGFTLQLTYLRQTIIYELHSPCDQEQNAESALNLQ